MSIAPDWPEERVELLVKLWNEGLSASLVAKRLPGVATRSAICAKINRLRRAGVQLRAASKASDQPRSARPPRPKKPQAEAEHPWGGRAKAAQEAPAIVVPFEEPEDPTGFEPIPESERPVHFCRWPMGDPLQDGFAYCGRPQAISQSGRRDAYCAAHASAARKPLKPSQTPAEMAKSLRRYL